MIAVIRAEDVRLISDGEGGWIAAPDVKFGKADNWGAYQIRNKPAFIVWFDRPNGERIETLWHGPHKDMGPGNHTLYFVQAPTRVLQRLRRQLGGTAVVRLKAALRARKWLRVWCRNNGFRPIKNSRGENVGVYPPLCIAGQPNVDLGDDSADIERADKLADLE